METFQKKDILSLTIPEISEFLSDISQRRNIKIESFRAKQIFSWLMSGVDSFANMSNLPANLRTVLCEEAYIATPKIYKKFVSKIDGTIKYLFALYDGECIESVFMRYNHGNTICISSQAGCRMGCRFCASTISGFSRNLTPSEILGQVIAAAKDTGEKISNIVMMGIGEPFDNFDNVIKFLTLVNDKDGLCIGYRHISISTCGIADKIVEFSKYNFPVTLSISLHAPNQKMREKLMPVAKKYNLDELISACRNHIKNGGRRISFEYTMIRGENDTKECATMLIKLLRGLLCHVNLIPLNKVKDRNFDKSYSDSIKNFSHILEKNNITVTVRRKLGSDIDASCGQLRASKLENKL